MYYVLIGALPRFVVANLDRVPALKPEELDVCMLLHKINRLAETVARHHELLTRQQDGSSSTAPGGVPAQQSETLMSCTNAGTTTHPSVDATAESAVGSWANLAAAAASSNSEWTVVQRKQKPKLPIPVRGAKTMDSSQAPATPGVRSVPRKPVLAAYVGRLHQDTTEEALTEYLKQEGMKGVTCRKLKSKDVKVYRTPAFYVRCCTESCELFYNEQC